MLPYSYIDDLNVAVLALCHGRGDDGLEKHLTVGSLREGWQVTDGAT